MRSFIHLFIQIPGNDHTAFLINILVLDQICLIAGKKKPK